MIFRKRARREDSPSVWIRQGTPADIVVVEPRKGLDGLPTLLKINASKSTTLLVTVHSQQSSAGCRCEVVLKTPSTPNTSEVLFSRALSATSTGLGFSFGRGKPEQLGVCVGSDEYVSRTHGFVQISPNGTVTVTDTSRNGTQVSVRHGSHPVALALTNSQLLASLTPSTTDVFALPPQDAIRGLPQGIDPLAGGDRGGAEFEI